MKIAAYGRQDFRNMNNIDRFHTTNQELGA